MKVRAGKMYAFNPCLMDMLMPEHHRGLKEGEIVRVVNLPGAPRANTMGHCHVERLDGVFIGMVATASLSPVKFDRKGRRIA